MKIQINMQQIKEHGKKLTRPRNEEVICSVPEREFRVITVKMIRNLENKMGAWINRLEARIEKTQNMFNRDLGQLKNKQSTINNAITDIKNALEGTDSRVNETEEQIVS